MPENESFEELPRQLVDRLKAADRAVPVITAPVDREIGRMARAHFASRRPALLRRAGWAAVAATVLLAVIVLQLPDPPPEERSLYADVDGSGRIDIADVLALAQARKRSQAELDAFASRIVSLEPRGDAS